MAKRYIGDSNAQMYSNLMPAGVVLPFAGATAPTGWLLCDGTSVSRTTYPELFAAIGTAHGTASGSTFNVPDYRGRFLRGLDGSAGRDPDKAARTAAATGGNTGNAVGSVQSSAFASHTHNLDIGSGSFAGNQFRIKDTAMDSPNTANTSYPNAGQAAQVVFTGGSETRPLNAYVNYIIKY